MDCRGKSNAAFTIVKCSAELYSGDWHSDMFYAAECHSSYCRFSDFFIGCHSAKSCSSDCHSAECRSD